MNLTAKFALWGQDFPSAPLYLLSIIVTQATVLVNHPPIYKRCQKTFNSRREIRTFARQGTIHQQCPQHRCFTDWSRVSSAKEWDLSCEACPKISSTERISSCVEISSFQWNRVYSDNFSYISVAVTMGTAGMAWSWSSAPLADLAFTSALMIYDGDDGEFNDAIVILCYFCTGPRRLRVSD